jgi:hypothetical protein
LAKVLIVRRPEWVSEHGDASRVTPNRASYIFALDSDFSDGLYTGFALSFGPAKAFQLERCRAEPGERFLSLTASVTLWAGLWPFKWLCHLWLLFIAIKSNSPLGRNSRL